MNKNRSSQLPEFSILWKTLPKRERVAILGFGAMLAVVLVLRGLCYLLN